MNQSIPRPEHPRPQFVRSTWLNLNGVWQFEIDAGRSGRARGLPAAARLQQSILLPFCPESALSGVEVKDFLPAVWYRGEVMLPAEWQGKRVLLHFGAVDYDAEVWVNGQAAGSHRGGYASFSLEITALLHPGANVITVCAEDDTRSPLQPSGKQSDHYLSYGCLYTRTTGIWQTVWLEAVPQTHLWTRKHHPRPGERRHSSAGAVARQRRRVHAQRGGQPGRRAVGSVRVRPNGRLFQAVIPLGEVRPWAPGSPTLYDLRLTLHAGDAVLDSVASYCGLRSLDWQRPGHPAQRQAGLPAAHPRPGVLSGRHLHRAER